MVVPSLNVTVPVALEGVTVAVSVTVCPVSDGFGLAPSAVVVVWSTFWLRGEEVLPV